MPYVHLANGEVLTLKQKELDEQVGNSAPNTLHRNGTQHQVIGIYPDDVELTRNEDEETADKDKAEFEEWKASRTRRQPNAHETIQDTPSPKDDNPFKTSSDKATIEPGESA